MNTMGNNTKTCSCKSPEPPHSDFDGPHCSVPGSVYRLKNKGNLKNFILRKISKRIVLGVIVNHELSWIEASFRQLNKTVDIFVILESQMTSGGDWKPLHFLNALKNGFLSDIQRKILYIYLENIPEKFVKDGWQTESLLRNYMSQNALNRIQGLQDHVFVLFPIVLITVSFVPLIKQVVP